MTKPYNWGGYITPGDESGIHRDMRFLVLIQGHPLEHTYRLAREGAAINKKRAKLGLLNMIVATVTIIISCIGAAAATTKDPGKLPIFITCIAISAVILNYAANHLDIAKRRAGELDQLSTDIEQEVLDGR